MPRALALLSALLPASFALHQAPGEQRERTVLAAGQQLASSEEEDAAGQQSVRLDELQRLEGRDGKCLNFLHIPKTGGTSIEETSTEIALERGEDFRSWGRNDTELRCSYPFQFKRGPGCKFPGLPANQWGHEEQRCSQWHTPPAWDDQLAESYSDCTTFCVVRHPVQRMVSEASYRVNSCDADQLEEYLVEAFVDQRERVTTNDCHLVPQSEYVFGGKILGAPGRYCQRVLKTETLSEDFARLMQEFGIRAKLKHSDKFRHDCDVSLSEPMKRRIQRMYSDDFKNFGYSLDTPATPWHPAEHRQLTSTSRSPIDWDSIYARRTSTHHPVEVDTQSASSGPPDVRGDAIRRPETSPHPLEDRQGTSTSRSPIDWDSIYTRRTSTHPAEDSQSTSRRPSGGGLPLEPEGVAGGQGAVDKGAVDKARDEVDFSLGGSASEPPRTFARAQEPPSQAGARGRRGTGAFLALACCALALVA